MTMRLRSRPLEQETTGNPGGSGQNVQRNISINEGRRKELFGHLSISKEEKERVKSAFGRVTTNSPLPDIADVTTQNGVLKKVLLLEANNVLSNYGEVLKENELLWKMQTDLQKTIDVKEQMLQLTMSKLQGIFSKKWNTPRNLTGVRTTSEERIP